MFPVLPKKAVAKRGRLAREIERAPPPLIPTGIEGVDRVFTGGGIPLPSVTMLGGGQGSGKSSLALQIAAGVGGRRVLYFSAEEAEAQVGNRIDRLGLADALGDMRIVDTDDMAEICDEMTSSRRSVVIVDSFNVLRDPDLDTADKNANQMARAEWFYDHVKGSGTTLHPRALILVMRLNKEDDIAGARDMQYLIDIVMAITRVNKNLRRLACDEKNRFGELTEAKFLMMKSGLVEVNDHELVEIEEEPHASGGTDELDRGIVGRARRRKTSAADR